MVVFSCPQVLPYLKPLRKTLKIFPLDQSRQCKKKVQILCWNDCEHVTLWLMAWKYSGLWRHFKANSYSEIDGVTYFHLVQQKAQLWNLAHPHQTSAWRCPHRQSCSRPCPPSLPPAPTPSAAWPRVRMKRMAARKAAAETPHWSSQMKRRYTLTQPSWPSQKRSRSKAQTTATRRPPSGHAGGDALAQVGFWTWKPVLHQCPDRRSADVQPDVSSWLNATLLRWRFWSLVERCLCSALRAALFRLLALWFLLHSFPKQINQHKVWYNSSYYLLHQNYIEINKHFTVFLLISLMYVAWICNAELIFEPMYK